MANSHYKLGLPVMSRNVFGRVYEPGKPLSISIPSARIDYISFQRRFFRKQKLQKSCGD